MASAESKILRGIKECRSGREVSVIQRDNEITKLTSVSLYQNRTRGERAKGVTSLQPYFLKRISHRSRYSSMVDLTQSLSAEGSEVATAQLLDSFSVFAHNFPSHLIPDVGTTFPEGPVPRWWESVRNVDLKLVTPRAIGLAGYQCLRPGPMETVDPRLLMKDSTMKVEQLEDLKELVAGSSRDFPVTIDDGIPSIDRDSMSPTETEDVPTEEIGYEARSDVQQSTFLLRYTPSSSDVHEEQGLDVDDILRDTPTRDSTPYLSTPPQTILRLSTSSRQFSNSPSPIRTLTPNTLPSPPTSAISSAVKSGSIYNPRSIDKNISHFSTKIPSLPPEATTSHTSLDEYHLNEPHTANPPKLMINGLVIPVVVSPQHRVTSNLAHHLHSRFSTQQRW
jgi:hypothetical protein